jgi:hypothetical protein
VVDLDRHVVFHLDNRHGGVGVEQLRRQALLIGGKMLDQHERQAAVGGQGVEETLEGIQASRRSTDTHHGKIKPSSPFGVWVLRGRVFPVGSRGSFFALR